MHERLASLKILLWNVENLFLLSDQKLNADHLKLDEVQWQKLSTSIFPNKALNKVKEIAGIIKTENPDLVLLCEVGGIESLQNFNRLFLEDQYSAALVEGNSDRNIDIGFLIRKDLGFQFDLISNKNHIIDYVLPQDRGTSTPALHKFSRDAAELHLFLKDRDRPFLVLLLTHLKSQLDRERKDPLGFERRQSELKALVEIYLRLKQKFSYPVPVAVCGDFNGVAGRPQTDIEFAHLYNSTDLIDVCEIANVDAKSRMTYFQVGRSVEGKQIDYCFLSKELQTFVHHESVRVYRYKDEMGFPLDPPSTLDAKLALPSDHYPLVFEVRNLPIF